MDNFFSSEVVVNEPNYSDLTVILPFRYSENNFGNMENFNVILNYLKFIGVKHIIISEEDEYSKINDFLSALDINFEDLQILFTKSETFFNKSIAINNAVKICNTPYVAIMDYGILVPKKSFDNALSLVDSFYDFVYASNDYFKEIDNLVNLLNDFDFKKINTIEEYALKYSNILFCKKEHLMNIGGYNPIFINDYYLDMELLLRIILSEFNLFYINDYSYHLNYSTFLSDEDINTFCNQYNFAKFNDINLLINRNEEMYLNSCVFKKNEVNSSSSKYLISVIIPIYNCKYFYIDRCITSLKNQTLGFENIEVILVDDSSIYPSSTNILNKYAEQYENVKIISLDLNSGAGVARNAGMLAATADYMTFLDHDDYFVKDICEIYYENMVRNDVDILISNFINLTMDSTKTEDWTFLNLDQNEKTIENSFKDMNIFKISSIIGSKVYKKDFLIDNQLFFPNYKVCENLLFDIKTLFEAKGIKLINVPSVVHEYRYDDNENFRSTSLKINYKLLMDNIKSLKECYGLFLKYNVKVFIEDNFKKMIENWIANYFFKVDLSEDEIKIVVNECYDLFILFDDSFLENIYMDLYNAVISKNYDEMYDIHKKNLEINSLSDNG